MLFFPLPSYKASKLSQSKNKNASKDLVPPDLWIHHDQMELKSLDKSSNSESNMTVTPIQRNSQELCHEPLLNTLEKKKSAYLGRKFLKLAIMMLIYCNSFCNIIYSILSVQITFYFRTITAYFNFQVLPFLHFIHSNKLI